MQPAAPVAWCAPPPGSATYLADVAGGSSSIVDAHDRLAIADAAASTSGSTCRPSTRPPAAMWWNGCSRDARFNIALGFFLPFLVPAAVKVAAAVFEPVTLESPANPDLDNDRMGIPSRQPVHARHRDGPDRRNDRREAAVQPREPRLLAPPEAAAPEVASLAVLALLAALPAAAGNPAHRHLQRRSEPRRVPGSCCATSCGGGSAQVAGRGGGHCRARRPTCCC